MSDEAPLSFGQLYSWREVESYPQAWLREANLPATWDLRGLTTAQVDAALRRLCDRHEPLRTSYHLRAGTPVQRIDPEAPLPVERVDRPVTDRGDPDRTTEALLAQPFPMTGALCWRGVLVSTGGAPMFLSLSFSHLIVDVWSIQELEQRFREILADPDAAGRPDPSPRELALRQRAANGGRDGAQRYWRRVLTDELVPRLPTPPAGAHRPRIQATLHSHRLGGLAAQAAAQHGVSPPAVLMALVTAGLARYTGAERVALSLMSSNRFSPEHRHVVGTMNQLVPVVGTVDPDSSLAAHVRTLHWAAARAYRHASYDIDRVMALAAEVDPGGDHDCWFNRLFPCWFNYLALDGRPSDPGARTGAELVWTPVARQYGQPFDVRVTVREGRTGVAVRVDPELVSAAALTDLLRVVALGVQRAVVEPQSTLDELWERPADLSPTLYPRRVPPPPAAAGPPRPGTVGAGSPATAGA